MIALFRYAVGLGRNRIDLGGAHLCKHAHVTRHISGRAYRRWEKSTDKAFRCRRCRRPSHPIHARGAR